ncbi:MAG: 30S ribosome-binding factor RbfA [Vicinamibacteria bacterium]
MTRQRGERVRPERLAEQIRMDAAEILQSHLKDPRLPLVTCTRVSVTNDLKSAKLYVSVLGSEQERERAMKVLEGATGYVRRLLADRLGLRSAPDIRFVFDPSIEYGIRLEELLQQEKERESSGEEAESEPDKE